MKIIWMSFLANYIFLFTIALNNITLLTSPQTLNIQENTSFLSVNKNVQGAISHVSVSAIIGFQGFQHLIPLTLYGYTSPKALVVVENDIFPQSVQADSNGFFEIADIFFPLSQQEACVSSYDSFGRLTSPLCLPLSHFSSDKDRRIGPVILPPTISTNKGNYFIGEYSIISGQTLPHTKILVTIYENTKQRSLSLAHKTHAFAFPEITTQSDNKGNYTLSFPTNHPSTYRVFIRTEYQNNNSPKSNTLFLRVYPPFMYLVAFVNFIIVSIYKNLLEFIFLLEALIFIILFVRYYFNPYRIVRSKAIIRYKPLLPQKSSLLPIKK